MKQPRSWSSSVFGAFALLACLAWPLGATWSIVAVDTATGEVAVASATCLTNFDLKFALPAIRVGKGGGAAQAAVDISATNRGIMADGFDQGLTSQQILDLLDATGQGNLQSQQYGIVSFVGGPRTHTGRANGAAARGTRGRIGSIKYAIQGNVLAGREVVTIARDAFVSAEGDLSQRVLAGMLAARDAGGDGRCSCDGAQADSCGVPPPGFEKSSHVGFMIVARMGDRDAPCNQSRGCADGRYWLDINVIGGAQDEDPVFTIEREYDQWRADHLGRPDGLRSFAAKHAESMPADGLTNTEYTVHLMDIEGNPLTSGGAKVLAQPVEGSEDICSVGEVIDNGDGTYSVEVIAGVEAGEGELEIKVVDKGVRATLFPYPCVTVEPVTPLHCGFRAVEVTADVSVPLVINEPGAAGAAYIILASASGTDPGTRLMHTLVPLNRDRFFDRSLRNGGNGRMPGTVGVLDDSGHAEAAFVHPPLISMGIAGGRVDWSAILLTDPPRVTNVAGFDVVSDED